jgi:predicted AAA+ superfamily ATPase
MHLARERHLEAVARLLGRFPVVAVLGARQVGKTTLARDLTRRLRGPSTRFDLEDPADVARLDDPMLALRELSGTVVLDEIQRRQSLFPVLRVLADRSPRRARFLLLGSASPELLRHSSETLAGRIAYYELPGLSLDEVGQRNLEKLWLRGGFPASYLARSDSHSSEWRRNFVRTFLERDIPQLGTSVPGPTLRRFWAMLAHAHGNVWNGSEFGRAFGVASTTVKRYLDLLSGAFVVRQLPPWSANLGKRQVKAPKLYVTDSGLLHSLLDLRTRGELDRHPKVGASWEGFALQQVVSRLGARPEECYFWATHAGAELDLLVVRGSKRLGFEFKRTVAPKVTRSMLVAREDHGLRSPRVVPAGDESFPLRRGIEALALRRVLEDLPPLRG